MELEEREREAETVIANLHRQLQAATATSGTEKTTGLVAVNGGVGDANGNGSAAQTPSLGRSPDGSDDEDGGGDARSRIEHALRHRPPLRAALSALLAERDRQLALLQHQLSAAGEQHRSELAERAAAADRRAELLRQQLSDAADRAEQLQRQLAAAHGRADQLTGEVAELRREHEQLAERAAESDRQHLSAAEAADRQRPEDAATILRLQEALHHTELQMDALRREKQQIGLELANRDASYSRLFPTGAPRVGVIDPTAASGGGGGRAPPPAPPAPPARQQRRPAGRPGRR
ncbi:putative ciliary rootlet coiled-coil protein-like 2 protein isoform X2 [Amphibalanus amphitrite]|uniref:putative ciliary rootlet coiled-coil protein-like 2 protein isoform X2 n=1 Tax=Amphibalanus amphitrite TaxID=1232801 RepID=UPI001C909CD0|nr:putative ciliary rootlet coiled-coil protein-like 2 protein isoform X2 [Amphibalanus amphitrite]